MPSGHDGNTSQVAAGYSRPQLCSGRRRLRRCARDVTFGFMSRWLLVTLPAAPGPRTLWRTPSLAAGRRGHHGNELAAGTARRPTRLASSLASARALRPVLPCFHADGAAPAQSGGALRYAASGARARRSLCIRGRVSPFLCCAGCYSSAQTLGIESGTRGGRLHSQFSGQSLSASHRISQVDVSPPGPGAVTQSWPSAHPDAGQGWPMPAVEVFGRSSSQAEIERTTVIARAMIESRSIMFLFFLERR